MTKATVGSLESRLYLKNKRVSDKLEGMLSLCKEVVSHLLEMYATDYVTAEKEMQMESIK